MGRAATRVGIAGLASVVLILSAAETYAAPKPMPHRLFRESPSRTIQQQDLARARRRSAKDSAGVVRFRPVRLDADGLMERTALSIALFDGAPITAVRDRIHTSHHGSAWVGHIPGKRFSSVTLSVKDGVAAGLIGWPGRTYRLSWVADGLHVLQELREDNLAPPCGGVAAVAPEAAGAAGSTAEAPAPARTGSDVEPRATAHAMATIDVLVVYTEAARDAAGSDAAMRALIDAGIAHANQAYRNSNVDIQLEWSWARVNYAETGNGQLDLNRLTSGAGEFAGVHQARNTGGFDLVQLVTERMNDACGWGWVQLGANSGFSVVARNCYVDGRSVPGHEIGHNLGSNHDRANSGVGQAFDYSFGYREPGLFHSIMAYDCRFACPGCAPCHAIQYFSNPDVIDPESGHPTGIAAGQADSADNARSMNETRWQVAGYRNRPIPDPTAPSNLIAEVMVGNGSEVLLTWQDNSDDETGFRIERRINDGAWSLLAEVAANGWSYSDTTAFPSSPPTTYHYRVQAFRNARNSGFSNEALAVMSSDHPTTPPTPIAPKGCVDTLRPTFSWSAVPNATVYWLIVSENPDFTFGPWVIDQKNITGTSFTPGFDLLPGHQYYWKVKAQSSTGFGPWSASSSFKPFCSANEPPLLLSPLVCTTQSQPTISWTPVAQATGYWLVVSDTWDMSSPGAVWWVNTIVPGTSYVPTVSFPLGVPFYFKVKSLFGGQGGAWSPASSFTVKVNCTPPVVSVTGGGSCHPTCSRTFTAAASDPDGDPLTFSWSGCASGTGATATCTATSAGTSTATVTVSDGHGLPASASGTLVGVNQNPTISLRAPDTCGLPCTLTFTATATDPDGDPLSYSWSGCASGTGPTAACTVGSLGEATATVTVSDGIGGTASATLTARAPERITWTGVAGAVVAGSTLRKNTGTNGYGDSGAISTKAIASGRGYAEFTVDDLTRGRIFGLSRGDSDLTDADVDFGLSAGPYGDLAVYEAGIFRGSFGTYQIGDTLRVNVDAGVVTYRRNGDVFYTSTTAPAYPLLVDTALNENGATVANAVVWGELAENVFWTYAQGVAASVGGLTRGGETAGWTAGAISSRALGRGDGYVEFTAPESNTARMCGLGYGDSSKSYTDIEFAVYPAADGIVYVYESGTSRGSFGPYAAGDRFRVAVQAGVVRYYRNGTLLYTSTRTVYYPLLVDASLYTPGATIGHPVLRGAPGSVVSNVAWKNGVGVAATGNSLTRGSTEAAWDSGAVSGKKIVSGDGFAEFTAADVWNIWMIGLGNGDSGPQYGDIEYAVYGNGEGFYLFEAGLSRGFFGSFEGGDRFRVAVESGVVKYYRNGQLFYTSGVAPQYPLLVDTSLYSPATYYTPPASILNVVIGGAFVPNQPPIANAGGPYRIAVQQPLSFYGLGSQDPDGVIGSYHWDFGDGTSGYGATPAHTYSSAGSYSVTLKVTDDDGGVASAGVVVTVSGPLVPENVAWIPVANATAYGNTLVKLDVNSDWNAGGKSTQSIVSGNGYVEFTAPDIYSIWMAGLGNADGGVHYGDIDFAVYVNGEGLYIYESGIYRGFFGTFEAGARFRVAVESGKVKYYRNGALFYTSAVTPAYPLLVDSSLYSPATYNVPAATVQNAVIAIER